MFPNVPCLYPRLIRQKCCQNSLMAESLFRVFDEDNSGALNFFEYLQVNILDLEFLNSNIEAHIYLFLHVPDLHIRIGKYLCFYVL